MTAVIGTSSLMLRPKIMFAANRLFLLSSLVAICPQHIKSAATPTADGLLYRPVRAKAIEVASTEVCVRLVVK